MTLADWRQLLEAYLDARLSAPAFARRLLEACAASRSAGRPLPAPIADIFDQVEQFDAEAQGRDDDGLDARDLERAVRMALPRLQDAAPTSGARTYDRARAREEMRRFQMHVTGCGGIGCAIALAWLALCLLQIYYVSEQIQNALGWGVAPSAIFGFVLAFVPIIGNLLAFFGATGEGWHPLAAAIVFFAAPVATWMSGWSRWRRFRR